MDQPSKTVIGTAAVIQGDLQSDDDIRIDGTLEGSVETSKDLTIGMNGDVKGDLRAHDITLEGQVTGDIYAEGVLEIGTNGHLIGDIFAAGLRIHDGGSFRGQVEIAGESSSMEGHPSDLLDDGSDEASDTASMTPPSPLFPVPDPFDDDDDDEPPAWDTEEHRVADARALDRARKGNAPPRPSRQNPQRFSTQPPRRSDDFEDSMEIMVDAPPQREIDDLKFTAASSRKPSYPKPKKKR